MPFPYYQQFPYPQMMQPEQYRSPQNMLQSQMPMTGTSQDERIWVQGEGAAQAYLVAPNSFVRLWDSSANVFYEKRADQTGRPFMDVYEYTRKGQEAPAVHVPASNEYEVQIRALERRIEALEKERQHEQSNDDDAGISEVQTELQRKSRK